MKKWLKYFLISAFWILVWQLTASYLDNSILLCKPFDVFLTLKEMIITKDFWEAVGSTFLKIITGFLLALCVGTILAVLSAKIEIIREMVSPPIKVIKATPVASFIILALVWIDADNLSVLISFMMVIPVIFLNVLAGFDAVDKKMIEMADVFGISLIKRYKYIFFPAIMPHLVSAISIGLGFCWKSGIAAEIIGLPNKSIGSKLYEAKLYLMTDVLFAWTIVIIVVSIIFEKIIMEIVKLVQNRMLG